MASYVGAYLHLVSRFRRGDFQRFLERHADMFREAKRTGDHRPVTTAYYDMMTPLIEAYYGPSWHFVPPAYRGQSRLEATRALYGRIAGELDLRPGTRALDLGCGVGGALRAVARQSGAGVHGVALTQGEVDEGNRLCRDDALDGRCVLRRGELTALPFEDRAFDAAYAIYSLKYLPDLAPVLGEIRRVLRPGGRLAVYCLLKTAAYDPTDADHVRIVGDIEYATGMPSLRTVDETVTAAKAAGFRVASRTELSQGDAVWFGDFVEHFFLPWAVSSRLLGQLSGFCERIGVLPAGFTAFNDVFVRGTVRNLIEAGRRGILTGSCLLVFRKE
jgi:SAM-dependent methyltransferase